MEIHADREALEYLRENLGKAQKLAATSPDGTEDAEFFDRPVHRVPEPHKDPRAETVTLRTLRGLADYLQSNVDDVDFGRTLIYVADPGTVHLHSSVEGYHRRRETLVSAVYRSPATPFVTEDLGVTPKILSLETARLFLQAICQEVPMPEGTELDEDEVWLDDRALLRDLFKKVKVERAAVSEDDGWSQNVSTSAGITLLGMEKAPNPARLRPFHAFPEIVDQVEVPYVVRFFGGDDEPVRVAFVQGDGGLWRLEACERVAEHLQALLPEGAPEVIF